MINAELLTKVRNWLKDSQGIPVCEMQDGMTPLVCAEQVFPGTPLRAIRIGKESVLVARGDWVESLQKIVGILHPDVLFSTFGAYELARVTLPDGVSVWGPDYHMFGDERTIQLVADDRVIHIPSVNLGHFDYSIFWHCEPDSLAGFAVLFEDDLLALSTVSEAGGAFLEISMDVKPSAQGNGLGMAVVNAAAKWILGQGKLVTATAAPFNSPSLRTLGSIGLRYGFTSVKGLDGPMELSPQQLGSPLPDTPLYNRYPDWAMNLDILTK